MLDNKYKSILCLTTPSRLLNSVPTLDIGPPRCYALGMKPFTPRKSHLMFSVVANKGKDEVKKRITTFLVYPREKKFNDIEDLFEKYFKIIKHSILKENTKALMEVHFEALGIKDVPKKERVLKKTTSKKAIMKFDYKQDDEYVLRSYKKLLKFSEFLSDHSFVLVFNISANSKNNNNDVKYELSIRTEYEKSEVF